MSKYKSDNGSTIYETIRHHVATWEWEDTFNCLGFVALALIVTFVANFLFTAAFGERTRDGFYIDSYSYYKEDANGRYVVTDSTSMEKIRETKYYVYESVSWDEDPCYLVTTDFDEAMTLYKELSSKSFSKNLQVKNIAELYKELPMDEKVKFLSNIGMLDTKTE